MLRPALAALAGGLVVTAFSTGGFRSSSQPDVSDLWSGPPPWTQTRSDRVSPRVAFSPPASGKYGEPDCAFPAPTPGADAIAVGLYESAALSSAVIGGLDQETLFVTVDIEPGKKPLDLALTSYESMVWRLTGDTGRVKHVTVSTYQHDEASGVPASGVIGVSASRLSFLSAGCLPYFHDAAAGRRAISRLFGPLTTSTIVASYSASAVSLPSGVVTGDPAPAVPTPPGLDDSEWRGEAARYWPGGVVSVDPRLIISPASVESYRVLPSQAGIAQLVESGAIVSAASGWRIVRPIAHLPPRMTGAHLEHLTLAAGIPMPPGDVGHACITTDSGGSVGLCRF